VLWASDTPKSLIICSDHFDHLSWDSNRVFHCQSHNAAQLAYKADRWWWWQSKFKYIWMKCQEREVRLMTPNYCSVSLWFERDSFSTLSLDVYNDLKEETQPCPTVMYIISSSCYLNPSGNSTHMPLIAMKCSEISHPLQAPVKLVETLKLKLKQNTEY